MLTLPLPMHPRRLHPTPLTRFGWPALCCCLVLLASCGGTEPAASALDDGLEPALAAAHSSAHVSVKAMANDNGKSAGFRIGGTLFGLESGHITLLNNGTDPLTLSQNGPFTFPLAVTDSYDIVVSRQPLGFQWCSVHPASQTATTDVNTVRILCKPAAAQVSTLAGLHSPTVTQDPSTGTWFDGPRGVVRDGSGNVYIADADHHSIRKLSAEGVVSTLAGSGLAGGEDGTGTQASFNEPAGLALDAAGNLYVADAGNHKIRKITPDAQVSTLAGDGQPGLLDGVNATAHFNHPMALEVDAQGRVLVSDTDNHSIRTIVDGSVHTLAGGAHAGFRNGSSAQALFDKPAGLALGPQGEVYVADSGNHCIRKISLTGYVTTLAGRETLAGHHDGPPLVSLFNTPTDVAADAEGNLYVADSGNHRVRLVMPGTDTRTLAGTSRIGWSDGKNQDARLSSPYALALEEGLSLLVSDTGNHNLRRIKPANTLH